MNRMLALAALLAAGCSGVNEDRPGCARSSDCPAGEYCAATADGAVCWPDAQPPEVSALAVTCGLPCLRDGTLRVEATVADDHEVAEVSVTLDLDPSRAVPMARAGARWVAQVPLATWPFPAFERAVVATVTARDGARNASAAVPAAPQTVTRLRWTYDAGVPMTSPAVLADGTAVVGLSDSANQLRAISDVGAPVWATSLGSGVVTSSPVVLDDAIWIGVPNGTFYGLGFDGSVQSSSCTGGEPFAGAAAFTSTRAVAGFQSAVIAVAELNGACNQVGLSGPVTAPPVVNAAGHVLAAASGVLHSFSPGSTGVLRADWTGVSPSPIPPPVGVVVGPIAAGPEGDSWTVSENGNLNRTTSDAITTTVATVALGSSGPIVLADGSVVVGSGAGLLQRIAADAMPPWTESEPLNGVPTIPLALSGERPALLAPTSTGRLYAIDAADGKIAWSVKLSATGQALQPANVHGVAGAPTATAYVAGADGTLYAVIVDGQLDAAAPWPKAFHDPRNTGNAGTLP